MGSAVGGWSARVPEIRHAVGMDEAAWGLANTASMGGDLAALALVTVLIGQTGMRRMSWAGAALILVNAPLTASASTPGALIAGFATWGFAASLLSAPTNAQAAEVERRYGRPLLSGFHACFSFALLCGGLLGTVAAALDITPAAQMAVTSLVLGVGLLTAGRWLPDQRPATRDHGAGGLPGRIRRRVTPRLLLLAFIAFQASFIEGAVTQWSAIYAADSLGLAPSAAAATYTAYAVAVAVTRLRGDRLTERLGRRRLLRLSSLAAGLGAVVVVARPHPAAAFVGFALLGVGIACVTPSAFAVAGSQPGLTAGEGVSVVVVGQWPGFLLAPPVIGALAHQWDLRAALATLLLAALCVAVAARAVPK
ncbi:MFS transporter [Streptomyces sp. Tu 3180]|uniref:MFS transporter n=1 Tax=Streptomyces sp. Tu 3180 TaxID=2682611 RepID=UPI003260ACAB